MNKGDIVFVKINDLSDDGKGIGRADGIAVFVDGAVPGDTVKACITRSKKNFMIADLAEIVEPSPDRIEAACPYFGVCGGCSMQSLSYERELSTKRDQIINKLARIGKINEPVVNEVIPCSSRERYRNKAVFSVQSGRDGKPLVGFKRRGSNDVVDCEDCLLQKYPAMAVAEAVRILALDGKISFYNECTGRGLLREVTVKLCEGTGEMMVIFTINGEELPDEEEIILFIDDAINECYEHYFLRSFVIERKKAKVIENSVNSASNEKNANNKNKGNNKKNRDNRSNNGNKNKNILRIEDLPSDFVVLAGSDTVTDTVQIGGDEFSFEISPQSFYQVNTEQMAKLYEKAIEYANLSGDETLFDLYCGVGTIGLSAAAKAGMVIGIESVKDAVFNANRNAVINGIVNARYYMGKAEKMLPRLFDTEDKKYAEYIDADAEKIALLDPPRAGCDQELLDTLTKAGVSKIVYISCDPGTLARDVNYLEEKGYNFIEATPVDMFPYTGHVETVCLLGNRD